MDVQKIVKRYFLLIFTPLLLFAFQISESPVTIIHTPDSILANPPGKPIYAADNKRYSTCPGIIWAQEDAFLITANYLGQFVGVFQYNEAEHSWSLLHRLKNSDGMQLGKAADVAVTQDGQIVAIANSGANLNVYEVIDRQHCVIHPTPRLLIGELPNQRMHGTTFSSDSKYLVYTTIDDPDQICIYRLDRNADGSLKAVLTQALRNLFHPLKPKSVAFSPDDRYLAFCFSERSQRYMSHKGRLASYRFDSETGRLDPKPLSVTPEGGNANLISPEGLVFANNGSALLVTDQVQNTVTIHSFNPENGTIGNAAVLLKNPEAALNFPHGIALSSDGKRLAVTNLGDDKINLYSVE